MKIEQVKEIANAVLYEGYLLYPYRHSAIKNRQRWTIGVAYPREYSEANGGIEPCSMQTECLVAGQGNRDTVLDIHVRFLHLLLRTVVKNDATNTPSQAEDDVAGAREWSMASHLINEPWEEGIEREVSVADLSLSELVVHPRYFEINLPGQRWIEDENPINEASTGPAATIVREQQALVGTIIIAAEPIGTDLFKLNIQVENKTPGTGTITNQRNAAILHSFVSTHTILQVRQGSFISLLDPPPALQEVAQVCQNLRTWPVLVGNEGECDTMLSSPIILYDYPQIAPESPGSLFDGTEIDEILTLRIMTLTDEEKEELRQGDERAREILDRTEALTSEQLMKLHGTIRSLRPIDEGGAAESALSSEALWNRDSDAGGEMGDTGSVDRYYPGEDYPPPASVLIAGREVKAGDSVRLRPGHGRQGTLADAFDILLDGKTARIETIHQDFENRIYLVVTLDDDPGREQWDERVLPGHRFFFYPEEVELLEDTSRRGI
jgi:hypothetical protein